MFFSFEKNGRWRSIGLCWTACFQNLLICVSALDSSDSRLVDMSLKRAADISSEPPSGGTFDKVPLDL